jgi:hypothetical protein
MGDYSFAQSRTTKIGLPSTRLNDLGYRAYPVGKWWRLLECPFDNRHFPPLPVTHKRYQTHAHEDEPVNIGIAAWQVEASL